jgi:hypothetical protein
MRQVVRRYATAAVVAVGVLAAATPRAMAQEPLLPSASWVAAAAGAAWHFSTPITQAAGAVTDVQEIAIPLSLRTVFGDGRWTLDASGAGVSGAVRFAAAGGTARTISLSGATDVRARLNWMLGDSRTMLTAGLTLPTGTTGLNGDQTAVLEMISAPGLTMPVAALGLGLGGTLGVVTARDVGSWSIAVGGSVEQRTEYTPIELAVAAGSASTRINPGTAAHLTVGAHRAVGDDRLSLLVVGDVYQRENVNVLAPDGASGLSNFQLGPQVSAIVLLDIAASSWREAQLSFGARYRSAFADATGARVPQSDGSYLEASVTGVHGGPTGVGFLMGAEGRYHTGLRFSDALAGATVAAVGAMAGIEVPTDATLLRLALRARYGQFDTGTSRSNGVGLSLVASFSARRAAQ